MGLRKKFLRKMIKKQGYGSAVKWATFLQMSFAPKVVGNLESVGFNSALQKFSKQATNKSELCSIMHAHGSDKGWARHNYTAFYSNLLEPIRNSRVAMFEVGIGTNNENLISTMGINGVPGASLRGWEKYFPNAQIFAADIDRNILFQAGRISCYYCDQTDASAIQNLWANSELENLQFNFFIDDGLHTFEGGRVLLDNSLHKLAKDGFYVIEDVVPNDLVAWQDFLRKKFDGNSKIKWATVQLPHPTTGDNNLIVIQA